MLNRLHHAGVITLTVDQYTQLHKLYYAHGELLTNDQFNVRELTEDAKRKQCEAIKNNVTQFIQIIDRISVGKLNILVRFIGDILADRGNQDYFTLYLLNH